MRLPAVFTFMTDVVSITVVMSLMGCSVGGFQGMNNLLMARTIGLERLTSMFSTTSLLVGIGSMSIGPFVGTVSIALTRQSAGLWNLREARPSAHSYIKTCIFTEINEHLSFRLTVYLHVFMYVYMHVHVYG